MHLHQIFIKECPFVEISDKISGYTVTQGSLINRGDATSGSGAERNP
jgi:hypothetical protein